MLPWYVVTQQSTMSCLSMRRELSSLEYSRSHSTQAAPYTQALIGYSLGRGRGGSLDCMWGVQTHSGPPVFLVLFRKDLARMNGTPRPNQKWPPALRIEPGSLDHESQPLTIGPVPDSQWEVCVESNSIEIGWELWYNFCVLEIQVVILFYNPVREYRIVFSEHWVLRVLPLRYIFQ